MDGLLIPSNERVRTRSEPVTDAKRSFLKLFRELCGHKRPATVFDDFLELSTLAIRKLTVSTSGEAIEEQYMRVVKRNNADDVRRMPELLALVHFGLADGVDFLGPIANELEILNARAGQFFTPWSIAEAMARITFTGVGKLIEEKGFITLGEPAVGAGALVLASAKVMQEEGFPPSKHLFVEATDIDVMAFKMCYLQLAVCGIPALVRRANSLSDEPPSDQAFTPAFLPFYAAHREAFDAWRASGVEEAKQRQAEAEADRARMVASKKPASKPVSKKPAPSQVQASLF